MLIKKVNSDVIKLYKTSKVKLEVTGIEQEVQFMAGNNNKCPIKIISKHKLIELNMTQVELAEQVGTSKQYLGKILFGERAGTMYIEKIDQVLQVSV